MKQKLGYVSITLLVLIAISIVLVRNKPIGFSCPDRLGHDSMYVCKFDNYIQPNERCKCVYKPKYEKKWQCEDK